jgi:hypothetical protein
MLFRFILAITLTNWFAILHGQDQDSSDCFGKFFKSGEKITAKSKELLTLKNNKVVSIAGFLKQNQGSQNEMMLKDLDHDGKKELVIYNFTGGAHCCDQFFFFNNTAPGKYKYSAKLDGGNTCVSKDTFEFSFTEYLGYFFTCYACGFPGEEEHPGYQYAGGVQLLYRKGKFQIIPGDEETRRRINTNLSILSKLKWDGGAGDDKFDDGRRKEVAMNLATYYFSFGKNLTDTKALFNKYYKFKDANKVWTAFAQQLNAIKSNDF